MAVQRRERRKTRGMFISMTNVQLTKFGVYRYRKGVPADLREVVGKREILKSLGTKDQRMALLKAEALDKHYDELFRKLRAEQAKPMGELEKFEKASELVAALGPYPHELRFEAADWVVGDKYSGKYSGVSDWEHNAPRDENFRITSYAIALAQGDNVRPRLTIKDALTLYLRDRQDKGSDNRAKFEKDRERSVDRLIAHLGGNRFIGEVSRHEARSYFEKVRKAYKPETANKELYLFKAIFDAAYRELELEKRNPWEGLRVHDNVPDRDKRDSFTLEQGRAVIAVLAQANVDLRRVGLVSALTGARLKEISGLTAEDVDLEAETPSLTIYPNGIRTVKNKASQRVIAPVGLALDALREAKVSHPTGPLFPRYADGAKGATRASAALMKMLRSKANIKDERLVWHSWRHTVKDLMRNAGVPPDLQNRILGHTGDGVSANYGRGPDIKLLADALEKALEPLVI
ncbi:site-specific integrase [Microvirga lotononidis]|uniref:Site-specific recombinase XerD n=1 Tax=Microvirga lotononidis TaxID=864069 RepID=I4YTA8_9HYPH|nr:site-specific integrase [Microvirga lotononidis]EIM27200.1 site-specific recombinase XerD [Microvirga lotononidis]WQO28620.1 site-specific integrase [Microvirga lotononidis]